MKPVPPEDLDILDEWTEGQKMEIIPFGGKTGPSEKSNDSIKSSMPKCFGSECHM